MKQYTEQEVFNIVWDHFVVKGNPRAYDTEQQQGCYEIYPGGPRCAVGLFLDDDTIRELRDVTKQGTTLTSGVVSVFKEYDPISFGLGGVSLEFLEDLQRTHDNADDPGEPGRQIRGGLELFASLHNLRVPE